MTSEADFRRRTLAGHYQSGPRLRGGDFAQQSRAALRRVACQASALSPDHFPEFMRATSAGGFLMAVAVDDPAGDRFAGEADCPGFGTG